MSGRSYSWTTVDDLLEFAACEIANAEGDGELPEVDDLLRCAEMFISVIESQAGVLAMPRLAAIKELRRQAQEARVP